MKRYNFPKKKDWEEILKRPAGSVQEIEPLVLEIFRDVKLNGNAAVKKYTKTFDKAEIADSRINKSEIDQAVHALDPKLKEAIALARQNIEKFHRAQFLSMPIW